MKTLQESLFDRDLSKPMSLLGDLFEVTYIHIQPDQTITDVNIEKMKSDIIKDIYKIKLSDFNNKDFKVIGLRISDVVKNNTPRWRGGMYRCSLYDQPFVRKNRRSIKRNQIYPASSIFDPSLKSISFTCESWAKDYTKLNTYIELDRK